MSVPSDDLNKLITATPPRMSWRDAKAQFEADAKNHSRVCDQSNIQQRLEEDALRSESAFIQSWARQIREWRAIVEMNLDDSELWEGTREEQRHAREGLRKYEDDLGKLRRTFDRRIPFWRHECLSRAKTDSLIPSWRQTETQGRNTERMAQDIAIHGPDDAELDFFPDGDRYLCK